MTEYRLLYDEIIFNSEKIHISCHATIMLQNPERGSAKLSRAENQT